MKILGKTATVIMLVLFFVSLCVLLYPSISQYWNAKVQSKAVADYNAMLDSMKEEDFEKYFAEANDYNERLNALAYPLTDHSKLKDYNKVLNLGGDGIMGYIIIDKIGVELPVYHGTSNRVLDTAVGHIEGTSLPVGGEGTHAALSAHRGLPNAKLFTNLDRLEVGDTFTLNILSEVLTYQVDQIKVVLPSEVNDIRTVAGEDYCTLITCTPYGINSHRLLVRGTRIETVETQKVYVTAEAYVVDRLIVTPAVALPILFTLIMIVMFKPVKPKKKSLIGDDED